MSYTIPFSELNKENISTAGGKGANLGELTATGLPVPPGFVLTTAAYDTFVEVNALQSRIVEAANSAENAAEQIRTLFTSSDIPTDIADSVLSAWRQLNAPAVAVRSSATAEDLPTASFAGQQDTFLNVQDEAALLEAVKLCWASLWTARAIAYRRRQGIVPESVSLAVVVQALVDADVSGILFTANPTNGDREQILINATWGLGEAIVGGLVTPDVIIVDKSATSTGSGQAETIISRETATKTRMTVRTLTGTDEQPIPLSLQNKPALDDTTALTLARYGVQIEAHYGAPMDIEWGIANGEIAILQARPITALPAAPLKNVEWEPPTPDTAWARRQIVEHMPEPLSPLFEDLYLKQGLSEALDIIIQLLGEVGMTNIDFRELLPQGFADTINGYAYTTVSIKMNGRVLLSV